MLPVATVPVPLSSAQGTVCALEILCSGKTVLISATVVSCEIQLFEGIMDRPLVSRSNTLRPA